MGSLTNFLANRKPPGINLDQLNLFEGKPVPTGLALVVPIEQLDEDPDNPRKEFPPEAIEELAQDIALRGILQPIVVSDRNDKGRYLIRFGSRRWRAAIQAGLTTVPVIFAVEARNAYDQVAENLKRQNLSPLELAKFIRRRVDAGESNAEVGQSPRTLHELSRLHDQQPEQVAALVSGTEPITREAVASLCDAARVVTPAVDRSPPTPPRPDKIAQALARATGLCERLDAALRASTNRLAVVSTDLSANLRILHMVKPGASQELERYRAGIKTLNQDIRRHLDKAAELVAELRATRRPK